MAKGRELPCCDFLQNDGLSLSAVARSPWNMAPLVFGKREAYQCYMGS